MRKYESKSGPASPRSYGEYAASVESPEKSVGRVPDALEARKLTQFTLVVDCRVPVQRVDDAPPFADFTGLRLPSDDGQSIRTLLGDGTSSSQSDFFWHCPHYRPHLGRPAAAMRRGDYERILFLKDLRREFYNLAKDIGAQQDIAGSYPKRDGARSGPVTAK